MNRHSSTPARQSAPLPERSSSAERTGARLEEFRALRARGALCTEVTEQLAAEAGSAFLNDYQERGEYLRDAIALLSEIATLEEPCLSEAGQRATFPLLVESLSDSFDPAYCDLYDRAFAQMIAACRRLPPAQDFDRALRRFGLDSEQDLIERKARLRKRPPMLDAEEQRRVRRVLIFSRVTLGADVAITSVVLQKAKKIFPQAEPVLLGSTKLRELFGGDAGVRIREARYATEGGLVERLRNWLPLLEVVEDEARGLPAHNLRPEEIVLLDPDSRFLQLGLLPALADESPYFFFESRRYGAGTPGSLSELTLRWLDEQFGGSDVILPSVSLRGEDRAFARERCGALRQGGAARLIAVSCGVGGNSQKRLPDPFEERLLLELLKDGCTVLLDKGAGGEEIERANRLVERVQGEGWPVAELAPPTGLAAIVGKALPVRLVTWQGGIGAFSALVAESDEYIGYDSAGQHIAAALRVPTIDVFSRNASPIFRERWRPTGRNVVKVVSECPADGASRAVSDILGEIMNLHQEIRLKG